ncbi:MAG: coniferyl aldehyde dehydrogenase [Sphingomonadaceae bacterium]
MEKTQMLEALERQRTAQTAAMPVSAATREDRLNRLIALLVDHGDALVKAMSEDFGHRSAEQSMITDILAGIKSAKHARKHMRQWMKPEKRPLDFPLGLLGARARLEYQPKGVVGIVTPWNFPVQLTYAALAGAYAAGNRCMVKASEFTPVTSALMAELGTKYFAEDELFFVSGGPEAGADFASLPFDHLIFTGATSVGKHIMRAAAENLVPVTLELGGKSPVIVSRTADIERAAARVALGKTLNAGQICLAPDYLLAPKEKEEEFVASFASSVRSMYPSMLANDDYTSVVNARHRERLQSYLDDASAKGAEVIEINPADEDFSSTNSNKMPVYVVRNVNDDMKVMQDEIFGPILPVMTYDRVEDAVDYVNAHDRPLGLYYFGEHADEERAVLDKTVSGGVTVNDVLFHVTAEDLPFGGVGPSGMGSYHGIEGFRTFSHGKSVYRQPKINVAKLGGLLPPYGKATQTAIKRDFKK